MLSLGLGAAGRAIGAPGLPTALVREGGYAVDDLGGNLGSFVAGFEGRGG